MTRRVLFLPMMAFAIALPLRADQYWVAWEGNDFPENEGWLREGTGSRASRSLLDSVMTLDSLANDNGQDFYSIYGAADPAPGEEFVVQYRLRVNQVNWDNPNFPYDPGWSIKSADGWHAVFVMSVGELQDALTQIGVPFSPGDFHNWEFRSSDMRLFTLALDGEIVLSGAFVAGASGAQISWGDFAWGPTSNVDWDYFRFGTVPEASTNMSILLLLLIRCIRR